MISDNIRSIQSGTQADNLLILLAQKDVRSGRVEDLGDGRYRLSDGTVVRRSQLARITGFFD